MPNRRWQQNWQFPTKKAIDSALQLASALSYLHGRAIEGSFVVHRDLKPENVAFSSDGRLKLFGKKGKERNTHAHTYARSTA